MCKWCDKIPCDDNLWEQGVSSDIRYEDGSFYTHCGDFYLDMPISYCPNCGKRLKLSMIVKSSQVKANDPKISVGNNSLTWGHLARCLREWT